MIESPLLGGDSGVGFCRCCTKPLLFFFIYQNYSTQDLNCELGVLAPSGFNLSRRVKVAVSAMGTAYITSNRS